MNTYAYLTRKGVSKIVIKFGYSGDARNVYVYTIALLSDPHYKDELRSHMHKYSGIMGKPFLVIVQPFNPVVANRVNEYRILFINGTPSPIAAFGFNSNCCFWI